MSPKGVYQRTLTNKPKPREYPAEIVALARRLYVEQGMTVAEVRAVFPKGYRVQTILERYLPERRPAAKREQGGEQNHMWKGEDPGYQAAHLRVIAVNGPARSHPCVDCGLPADDWSYNHTDEAERRRPDGRCPYSSSPEHYSPRCRRCHRAFDRAHRKEVMPHDS